MFGRLSGFDTSFSDSFYTLRSVARASTRVTDSALVQCMYFID